MFHIVNNLKLLSVADVSAKIVNKQSVRWRVRKPIALGTAKSKLFRVPPQPVVNPEEDAELKRLFNNYRTQIKSLRRYFTLKYATRLTAKVDSEQLVKEHEEDYQRCFTLNNEWNETVRIQREARFASEQEEKMRFAENTHVEKIQEMNQQFSQNEELVRSEIAASKTFITEENIDVAIDIAINNTVDYNYAIDLTGDKIVGRETSPKDIDNNEISAIKL